jgi:hypothetical protein
MLCGNCWGKFAIFRVKSRGVTVELTALMVGYTEPVVCVMNAARAAYRAPICETQNPVWAGPAFLNDTPAARATSM